MRISFQTGYRNSLHDIERAAEDLARAQRQVSSGYRMEAPSDDPTAAAGAVAEHAEVAAVDSYRAAADSANARLMVADTILGHIVETITQTIAVATGTLGDPPTQSQREAAARELGAARDALFADFNATFRGTYLFSGATQTTAPYSRNADNSVTGYLGSTATTAVDVDRRFAVTVTFEGEAIAKGSDTDDVFAVLEQLIADVQAGAQSGIQAGLAGLRRAFDRAVLAQTRVGTDEAALVDQQGRLQSLKLASATRLAAHENANLAEAISDMTRADAAHRAALGAAANVTRPSLLDYLK